MLGVSMLIDHQGYLSKIPAAPLGIQQRLMDVNLRCFLIHGNFKE